MDIAREMTREEIEKELQDIPKEASPYAILKVQFNDRQQDAFYGANGVVKNNNLIINSLPDDLLKETEIQIEIPLKRIFSVEYLSAVQAAHWLTGFRDQLKRSTETIQALTRR